MISDQKGILVSDYFKRGNAVVITQAPQVVDRRFLAIRVNGVSSDRMCENLKAYGPADVCRHHLQSGYRRQEVKRIETSRRLDYTLKQAIIHFAVTECWSDSQVSVTVRVLRLCPFGALGSASLAVTVGQRQFKLSSSEQPGPLHN